MACSERTSQCHRSCAWKSVSEKRKSDCAECQAYIGVQGPHFRDLFRREVDNTDETAIARECQQFPIDTDIDLTKSTQKSGVFLWSIGKRDYLVENVLRTDNAIKRDKGMRSVLYHGWCIQTKKGYLRTNASCERQHFGKRAKNYLSPDSDPNVSDLSP